MMNKKCISSLILSFLLITCAATAFAMDINNIVIPEYTVAEYTVPFETTLTGIDALKQPCDEQGSIVSLSYTTPAYAINEFLEMDETIERTVQVYLPYGYDESQQYDILYLLHGTGGTDTYWFYDGEPETTRNVLDNMIAQGLCKPLIVVTPAYVADIRGNKTRIKDEVVIAYGEETNDPYLLSRNDLWTQYFQYELVGNIIPLIETTYSTYASGDVSEESLIASREHRAFAGLSRGSMTTMRSGMVANLDKFAWFGNFSGIWLDIEKLEAALADSTYDIKYWYNGTGTDDFAAENHLLFHNEAVARLSDHITDGENYCMIVKDGGAHDFPSWIVDLYNSLLVFFH